jgi:signal transduction histidine kinase
MGEQQAPQIRVGARVKDGMLHCFVSDNGIGIEDQFQQQIFGLFQRLSNDTDGTGIGLALVKRIVELSNDTDGTGIGLALVKRIVEVHGGKVWVESEGLGTGTTLWFTLPCSASPEAQVSKEPVIAAN